MGSLNTFSHHPLLPWRFLSGWDRVSINSVPEKIGRDPVPTSGLNPILRFKGKPNILGILIPA